MVYELTEERIAEWIEALTDAVKKAGKDGRHDITIDYRSVSHSFPDDKPHPDYFYVPKIAWDKLRAWADEFGWDVQPAPECTHPEQQDTPVVRFTKRTQG